MEIPELAKQDIWYHNIELAPGVITAGRVNKNSSITRKLLRGVDLKGAKCVDIGAMDGFYAVLMLRKGAEQVIAFDRLNRRKQIRAIKKALGISFQYRGNRSVVEASQMLPRNIGGLADYVNFPGVLYHMYDPMSGLARMRGMTRRGGLVLVDTPAYNLPHEAVDYNHDGQYYTPTTYFLPTLRALQQMMLRVGLYPIACLWGSLARGTYGPMVRVSVMCRSWDPAFVKDREVLLDQGEVPLADAVNLREFALPGSIFPKDEKRGKKKCVVDDAKISFEFNGRTYLSFEPDQLVDIQSICDTETETPFDSADNVLNLSDIE